MYFECRYIMHNGARCHSPALLGMNFCYYHARLRRIANRSQAIAATPSADAEPLQLPFLEDRSAIQVALSQILGALGSSKLDPRTAGLFLYGLQIATQNVERKQDIVPFNAVESVTHTRDGDELAPETRICESSDHCSTCEHRDSCEDFEPEEDDTED